VSGTAAAPEGITNPPIDELPTQTVKIEKATVTES